MVFSPSVEEESRKIEQRNEVFAHPILNAMNRLLIHYLLGNDAERVTELFTFVTEAFVERNIRKDFICLLYQPLELSSPYRMISFIPASSLVLLFQAFYTYIVELMDDG